jgi:hypothetical protein
VEINELLAALDRTAANLQKLEKVWDRAQVFIPTAPTAGSPPEYDDLCRAWNDLCRGLPPIDDWTITSPLPDIDAMGRAFIDYAEADQIAFPLFDEGEQPGRDLAEYRYRLNRARRRAAQERLEQLVAVIDRELPRVLGTVERQSNEKLTGPGVETISVAFAEIERLVGDTAERRGRWSDLSRHIYFSEGHDWHDIAELDWPTVKLDVEAALIADSDPLPVPAIDLGHAASGKLTGAVATALSWSILSADAFERLLFNLLSDYPSHQNVQWLTHTNAPDRGRDLSFDRLIRDATGGTRVERVIVQAKHWLSRSVSTSDVNDAVAATTLWEPPAVHALIVATSGRFTSDAIAFTERHNSQPGRLIVEPWPDSKLESLLAQKPHIAAASGLR